MSPLEWVFCASIGWLAYGFVAYPLATSLLGVLRRTSWPNEAHTPSVTVVIAASNEGPALREKLEDTLGLEYPEDQLEILVAVDDGASDSTLAVARSFEGPRLRIAQRRGARGKNLSMDYAVARARGEILIFTDVTSRFEPAALRHLVSNFANPKVGCVGGRVRYRDRHLPAPKDFEVYKRVEERVRNGSNALGYVPSVPGAIHALRRELYEEVENHFTRDVIDPAQAAARGYLALRDPRAVCVEAPWATFTEVFRSRIRVTMRGVSATPYILGILAGGHAWAALLQFSSHKVLRWWAFVPALLALTTSAILAGQRPIYGALFASAMGGLALAGVGAVAAMREVRIPILGTLGFYLMNVVAMAIGSLRTLRGARAPLWRGTPGSLHE